MLKRGRGGLRKGGIERVKGIWKRGREGTSRKGERVSGSARKGYERGGCLVKGKEKGKVWKGRGGNGRSRVSG